MKKSEIKKALQSMVLLVDTREQDNFNFSQRLTGTRLPFERQKLDFGDYSAKVVIDEMEVDFSSCLAIERKMSLDELVNCFTKDRGRFEREFQRAQEAGAKMYLLVENTTWDTVYKGRYRSQMNTKALIASIDAWRARYDISLEFVPREYSGERIRCILEKEIAERLKDY